jgi:hypothetical protein
MTGMPEGWHIVPVALPAVCGSLKKRCTIVVQPTKNQYVMADIKAAA